MVCHHTQVCYPHVGDAYYPPQYACHDGRGAHLFGSLGPLKLLLQVDGEVLCWYDGMWAYDVRMEIWNRSFEYWS